MSASDSSAMAAMWSARSWKPRRISFGVWAIGRPICQLSSSPSSSARATHHAAIRRQMAARSATGTRRQARCAATALLRDFSICTADGEPRST